MYSVYLKKRLSEAIPHFIIRNFLFDILRFAVPNMYQVHTRWQIGS